LTTGFIANKAINIAPQAIWGKTPVFFLEEGILSERWGDVFEPCDPWKCLKKQMLQRRGKYQKE
jgi:hypothetical protein